MDIFSAQALWHLKGAVAIHAEAQFPSESVETAGKTYASNFKRYSCNLPELAPYHGFTIVNRRRETPKSCFVGLSPGGLPSLERDILAISVTDWTKWVTDRTNPDVSRASSPYLSNDSIYISIRTISRKKKLKETLALALEPRVAGRDNSFKDHEYIALLSRENRPRHFH